MQVMRLKASATTKQILLRSFEEISCTRNPWPPSSHSPWLSCSFMASATRTVTVPAAAAASDGVRAADATPGSWALVSTPASSPTTSETSSDGSSDLSFWFQKMGAPCPEKWARKFYDAGYGDVEEVAALAAADLDNVFTELGVPSGIQKKLRTGIPQFRDGTLASMPQGDLDATAPVQSEGFNWWFWGCIAVAAVVVAAAGAMVLAKQAAAAEVAAAKAAKEAAAAAAAAAAKAAEEAAAAAAAAAAEEAAAAAAAAAAVAATQEAAVVAGAGVAGSFAVSFMLLPLVVDCLDGETLVTMADRSKKKIKDVKVGDKILSYNKGKLRVKTVVKVKEGQSNTMRELFLQTPDGKDFRIKATGGHPFYTKEKDWAVISPDDAHFDTSKPVKKLSVGDTLVLRSGAGAKLLKIGEALPRQKTYNLSIDGPGTFFVEGILSHSGLPPPKK